MRIALGLVSAVAIGALAQVAQSQDLRIGYINTLNHPVGKEQVNGFKAGLAAVGWKKDGDTIAGVSTKVVFCDDQQKPDVGLTCAKKLIEQENVQIVAGITWSNVLAAVSRTVVRSRRVLLGTNAGWSGIAGRRCSRYFVTTSWNNDQSPEAMGQLMREEGLKSVFLLAPNYQAGKDMLSGFKRFYKGGRVTGQILFKLGNRDFQAELTRVRAARPESVFIFAPGPMGIAFMKQWQASGLGKTTKLYSVYTIDYLSLKPVGKAAVGTFHTNYWDPESKRPANVSFIAEYKKMFGRHPSHYAAQAYDAPRLIEAALKKLGGKVPDTLTLVKTMRKVKYDSIRGDYRYNVNGVPIQPFYKREVVLDGAGAPVIKTTGVVFNEHRDAYWRRCPRAERH